MFIVNDNMLKKEGINIFYKLLFDMTSDIIKENDFELYKNILIHNFFEKITQKFY